MDIPNLDDEHERDAFLEANARTSRGRFGTGPGSVKLGQALRNYAWNKRTAVSCRLHGDIPAAMIYETICDRIYKTLPADKRW